METNNKIQEETKSNIYPCGGEGDKWDGKEKIFSLVKKIMHKISKGSGEIIIKRYKARGDKRTKVLPANKDELAMRNYGKSNTR